MINIILDFIFGRFWNEDILKAISDIENSPNKDEILNDIYFNK